MIDTVDCVRIMGDVGIALDSLNAIADSANAGTLHEDYLKENVDTVKRCIKFFESFYTTK